MAENADELIPTRWTLVSRLKDLDDQESWRAFFDTYWKLIYGVAVKSGLNDSEAQDVVQETVLSVAKKVPGFKTDPAFGSFKGWLLHITRWRIADQLRKKKRDRRLIGTLPEDTDRTAPLERVADPAAMNLEVIWDEEWEKNLVDAAIEKVKARLHPKQYQMFDLYVLKKWPAGEVARSLHVNMGQVYLAKHRVSALIKREIKALESTYA